MPFSEWTLSIRSLAEWWWKMLVQKIISFLSKVSCLYSENSSTCTVISGRGSLFFLEWLLLCLYVRGDDCLPWYSCQNNGAKEENVWDVVPVFCTNLCTDRKSYLLRLQNFFGRRMYSCKPTRILICTGRSPKSNSTLLEGENYQAFEDLKKTLKSFFLLF